MTCRKICASICSLTPIYGVCRTACARAVLLYGAPGTGKTLLARGMAGSAGALLLDLSPRATDGKPSTPA